MAKVAPADLEEISATCLLDTSDGDGTYLLSVIMTLAPDLSLGEPHPDDGTRASGAEIGF